MKMELSEGSGYGMEIWQRGKPGPPDEERLTQKSTQEVRILWGS
jgi:hypothetical protein